MSKGRRLARIKVAAQYAARSRSKLYEWAPKYRGLFLKDGRSTIVDLDRLDEVLAIELEPAEFNAPNAA